MMVELLGNLIELDRWYIVAIGHDTVLIHLFFEASFQGYTIVLWSLRIFSSRFPTSRNRFWGRQNHTRRGLGWTSVISTKPVCEKAKEKGRQHGRVLWECRSRACSKVRTIGSNAGKWWDKKNERNRVAQCWLKLGSFFLPSRRRNSSQRGGLEKIQKNLSPWYCIILPSYRFWPI